MLADILIVALLVFTAGLMAALGLTIYHLVKMGDES